MKSRDLIDLRTHDATERGDKPAPDFQPADAMDVQNAREVITRMRIKRLADGFRREREGSKPA